MIPKDLVWVFYPDAFNSFAALSKANNIDFICHFILAVSFWMLNACEIMHYMEACQHLSESLVSRLSFIVYDNLGKDIELTYDVPESEVLSSD
jgi:hypothetical protein